MSDYLSLSNDIEVGQILITLEFSDLVEVQRAECRTGIQKANQKCNLLQVL